MPKFKFQLETLRRLRERRRDELRQHLAQAQDAAEILAGQRSTVVQEAFQLQERRRHALDGETLDVNLALQTQRYQMVLQSQSQTLLEQIGKVEQEVERRRMAVVEADREVKALDKLEVRKRDQYRRDQETAENKRLDEIGSLRRGGDPL